MKEKSIVQYVGSSDIEDIPKINPVTNCNQTVSSPVTTEKTNDGEKE